MDRVGFGPRLAAGFFEAVALLAVLVTGWVLMYALFLGWDRTLPRQEPAPMLLAAMIFWNLIVLLVSGLEFLIGRGFGKVVTGLTILGVEGSPADTARLFGRWLIRSAPLVVVLIATPLGIWQQRAPAAGDIWTALFVLAVIISAVSFLFCLGRQRLALHDRLTGTAVFRQQTIVPHEGLETFDQ